jgi:hypothetical protein
MMALFVPLFLAVQTLHWIGLLLDEILFPGYRNVCVRQPVFIVGVPRSGTTLLHRVLARDSRRFTTFALWELLFAPSVTERKICRGLGRLDGCCGRPLRRATRAAQRLVLRRLDSIHRVSLGDPEEDYFTLLPVFACFLLVLAYPSSSTVWKLARFDRDVAPPERTRIMSFYRACLQRHLFVHGPEKTLLSKNPSFSSMVESLRETFPDCRIICTTRSPLSAVPSLLSAMRGSLLVFNGVRQWDDFQARLIRMLDDYYAHLATCLSKWPDHRHVFVDMGELCGDLRQAVGGIYERLEFSISPEFRELLEAAHQRACAYKSTHGYSLEQFGLDDRTIRKEFAHAFASFDFDAAAGNDRRSPETVA